jgi:hypothetical protein
LHYARVTLTLFLTAQLVACSAGVAIYNPPDDCTPENETEVCAAGETCVEGVCTAGASAVCSAAEPSGACAAGNVCVAGTCIPIGASNECTPSRPTGLCPDNQSCDAGTCVPIDSNNECKPDNPTGLCDGGAICDSGVCTVPSCSPTYPYGTCPPDERCADGSCELWCSPTHPTGFCPATEVCVDGSCECDVACGSGCDGSREVCDTDPLSPTCGECICDGTCVEECGAGKVCDSNPASGTCGQCICDGTCVEECGAGKVCDSDSASETCGQCVCDTACGNSCVANEEVCISDVASDDCGKCICDTTCGDSCVANEEVCDSDLTSDNCGECICDVSCGNSCSGEQTCDSDPNSLTCGQCSCDTTCGGGCGASGATCDSDPASGTCGECVCTTGEYCSVADKCCASGEVCIADRYCRPPCASGEYCGAAAEICCDTGEICGPDLTCIIDCPTGQEVCGADWDVCCGANQVCIYQGCLDLGATCSDFRDCDSNQYCEPTLLRCLPTDIGGGEDCSLPPPPNIFNPEVEWHWLGTQADGSDCTDYDDNGCYRNAIVTPMVADLDRVEEPELTWTSPTSGETVTFPAGLYPEVVLKAYPAGDELGSHALVILDGRTGETKSVSSDATYHGNVLVGNLDSDAKLEVVHATNSGIVALDPFFAGGSETDASWSQNSGSLNRNYAGGAPAVTDLNGDGLAEVFIGGVVVDGVTGNILADFGAANQGGGPIDWYQHWYASAVADVDLDGRPEILLGNKAVEVSETCDWVATPCDANQHCEDDTCVDNAGTLTWSWKVDWDASAVIGAGFPGVGNFVDNMLPPYNELDDPPEVVVTIDGEVAFLNGRNGNLMTALDGETELFFELFDWRGGAPNIADFDGDSRVEMSFAGPGCMVVVDVDCAVADAGTRAAMPAGCAVDPATIAACTDDLHSNTNSAEMAEMIGVLWMDATQDESSAGTGTSVFDFQGDGIAEVLYNDECFLRVYNGEDGTLYMERPNSSRTGSEYPIVVDVDGDRSSEIVLVANNDQASIGRDKCAGEQNSALAYWADQDLYDTDTFCDETSDPSSRPDDRYDICRNGTWGVWSLGDVTDLWVRTLPYWHQHTFHVTDVTRDGQPVADWGAGNNNWDVYNNYRQNVQGYVPLNAPNLTIANLVEDLRGCPSTVSLRARIANMGSAGYEPAVDGNLPVSFYKDTGSGWEHIDTVWITTAIPPGQGLTLTFDYALESGELEVDFSAVVNDDGGSTGVVEECEAGDNVQYVLDVVCELG